MQTQSDKFVDPMFSVDVRVSGQLKQDPKSDPLLYSPTAQAIQVSDDPEYPSPGPHTHDRVPFTINSIKGDSHKQSDSIVDDTGLDM